MSLTLHFLIISQSPSENVELHRRLFVAVLSIAEEMFAIYLGKATSK